MTTDILTLARRLRAARLAAGLSGQSAGAYLGLPRQAIYQIEHCSRNVSALELARLAELYKVPIGDLVAFDALDDVTLGTRPVSGPTGGVTS
jgi:transcriptional regulator with XRE-family HTH domain